MKTAYIPGVLPRDALKCPVSSACAGGQRVVPDGGIAVRAIRGEHLIVAIAGFCVFHHSAGRRASGNDWRGA